MQRDSGGHFVKPRDSKINDRVGQRIFGRFKSFLAVDCLGEGNSLCELCHRVDSGARLIGRHMATRAEELSESQGSEALVPGARPRAQGL